MDDKEFNKKIKTYLSTITNNLIDKVMYMITTK